MTERPFNFKTDVKVELLIPNPGIFILGQSVLDGTDVLGGDSEVATWVDTLADVSDIYVNQGVDLRAGTLSSLTPSIASISLQTKDYDPNTNRAVHVGTGIRIRVLPLPNSNPTFWTTIFQGKITTYETTYNFDGLNTILFECSDALLDVINTPLPVFNTVSTPSPMTEVIATIEPYFPGGVINYTSIDVPWCSTPKYAARDTTVGEVFSQILDTEIGLATLFIDTQELYFYPNSFLRYISQQLLNPAHIIGETAFFSTIHPATYDGTHYCISDVVFSATANDAVNEIIATRTETGTKLTKTNSDSVDLYGRMGLEADVNVWSDNQLQLWLNRVSVKNDIRRVKSLSFRMLDQNANIRYQRLPNDWFMNSCNLVFTKGGLNINENYLISRVEHTITPTSWDTTLELWKGL